MAFFTQLSFKKHTRTFLSMTAETSTGISVLLHLFGNFRRSGNLCLVYKEPYTTVSFRYENKRWETTRLGHSYNLPPPLILQSISRVIRALITHVRIPSSVCLSSSDRNAILQLLVCASAELQSLTYLHRSYVESDSVLTSLRNTLMIRKTRSMWI